MQGGWHAQILACRSAVQNQSGSEGPGDADARGLPFAPLLVAQCLIPIFWIALENRNDTEATFAAFAVVERLHAALEHHFQDRAVTRDL